jgi:RNA polymerase sigma-70 factor, ECF subfamily
MRDAELLERLRQGDASALEALHAENAAGMCRLAARITGSMALAEEIVGDVFVRVWERHRALAIRSTLRAYLYGAVRQEALQHNRAESNRERLLRGAVQDGLTPGLAGSGLRPDEALQAVELAALITRTIDNLPDRAREAFLLQRQHELTQVEIADAMGIAVSTVEKHLARAMTDLKQALDHWREGV